MHHLLIAESSFSRVHDALKENPETAGIVVTTINADGELKTGDQLVDAKDLDITLIRLDWDLFGTGQMSVVLRLIDQASNLEFAQTSAAGLDNPMFRKVVSKAGAFCNSDAQAPPIAEYVVASVLNRWHRFDLRAERQSAREWRGNAFKEMIGSRWVLIGFGNICQRIARQLQGFGANVTAIRRNQAAHELAEKVDSLDNVKQHLPNADVVVLGCALNNDTRGLVDLAFLEQMKQDAVLVNIARGGIVVEQDLATALDQSLLDYAVLDVFEQEPLPEDHPFWGHDRIQVTPHSSNSGYGTGRRGDALFLENLNRYLTGQPLRNLVDPDSF